MSNNKSTDRVIDVAASDPHPSDNTIGFDLPFYISLDQHGRDTLKLFLEGRGTEPICDSLRHRLITHSRDIETKQVCSFGMNKKASFGLYYQEIEMLQVALRSDTGDLSSVLDDWIAWWKSIDWGLLFAAATTLAEKHSSPNEVLLQ